MKRGFPFLVAFLVLIAFTVYFIFQGNYEFILYALTNSIFILVLYLTDKKFKYYNWAKWGFVLWLVLHVAGGSLYFRGTRFYDLILIDLIGPPLNILKYDQLVHTFSFFIITLFGYSALKASSDKNRNRIVLAVLAVLVGMGVGALNEVIEFIAVVFYDAAKAVGDYYNNALDLVFNLFGAVLAVLVSSWNNKRNGKI